MMTNVGPFQSLLLARNYAWNADFNGPFPHGISLVSESRENAAISRTRFHFACK
ncbi:hypothetical protein CEXT_441491, partial [Caerostris extrusa]